MIENQALELVVHISVPSDAYQERTAPALLPFHFPISLCTSLSTLTCNSGLYPNQNKNSNHTKHGAKKTACTTLSSSAGARPSKMPCPMNCATQLSTKRMPAAQLAVLAVEAEEVKMWK